MARSSVVTIGLDGGYVRLAGHESRRDGWFEVIVGKSQRTDRPGGCFGYVQRLESDPAARMGRFLTHEGIEPDQPVTFLSDGGDTVRQAQFGSRISGEWILDWFHIAMRFQNMMQIAKGLPRHQDPRTYDQVLHDLERAKWHLWHGCWHRCLERLQWLTFDLVFDPGDARTKLEAKLEENITYISRNRVFIVNYGDRHRHGEPIAIPRLA